MARDRARRTQEEAFKEEFADLMGARTKNELVKQAIHALIHDGHVMFTTDSREDIIIRFCHDKGFDAELASTGTFNSEIFNAFKFFLSKFNVLMLQRLTMLVPLKHVPHYLPLVDEINKTSPFATEDTHARLVAEELVDGERYAVFHAASAPTLVSYIVFNLIVSRTSDGKCALFCNPRLGAGGESVMVAQVLSMAMPRDSNPGEHLDSMLARIFPPNDKKRDGCNTRFDLELLQIVPERISKLAPYTFELPVLNIVYELRVSGTVQFNQLFEASAEDLGWSPVEWVDPSCIVHMSPSVYHETLGWDESIVAASQPPPDHLKRCALQPAARFCLIALFEYRRAKDADADTAVSGAPADAPSDESAEPA